MHRPLTVCLTCALLACGCSNRDRELGTEKAPADEAKPGRAGALHISRSAQEAIGLRTEEVQPQEVADELPLTGWLLAKPGHETTIKAPNTGYIVPVPGEALPDVGARVTQGARLALLESFVSPIEQAHLIIAKEEADTVIEQSQVTMRLAKQQLDALEKEAKGVVAETRVRDLQETLGRAQAAYNQARDKLRFLPEEPYLKDARLGAVDLTVPRDGRVLSVQVSPRQLVSAGDPLWTIADWSALWVRVPVFSADLPRVLQSEPATLTPPGTHQRLPVVAVQSPQPTAPDRQTVDLFFELANPHDQFRPGQAVSISLPTSQKGSRIVVSRSAILWDGLGTTWVYVYTAPDSFHRRKVELGPLAAAGVVVARGLQAEEHVVVSGAESLYGEEFKGDIQVDDDD